MSDADAKLRGIFDAHAEGAGETLDAARARARQQAEARARIEAAQRATTPELQPVADVLPALLEQTAELTGRAPRTPPRTPVPPERVERARRKAETLLLATKMAGGKRWHIDRDGYEDFAAFSLSESSHKLGAWCMDDGNGTDVAAAIERVPELARRRVLLAACGEYERAVGPVRGQYARRKQRPGSRPWRAVRTLRSHVARRRAGIWLLCWRLGSTTTRTGMSRIVEGICRGSFGSAFRDPRTKLPPSRRTLEADFRALRLSGALVIDQPPAAVARPEFVGRDRYGRPRAIATIAIPSRLMRGRRDDDDTKAAAAELAPYVRPDQRAPFALLRRRVPRPPRPAEARAA